jgi:hypothetical protein
MRGAFDLHPGDRELQFVDRFGNRRFFRRQDAQVDPRRRGQRVGNSLTRQIELVDLPQLLGTDARRRLRLCVRCGLPRRGRARVPVLLDQGGRAGDCVLLLRRPLPAAVRGGPSGRGAVRAGPGARARQFEPRRRHVVPEHDVPRAGRGAAAACARQLRALAEGPLRAVGHDLGALRRLSERERPARNGAPRHERHVPSPRLRRRCA